MKLFLLNWRLFSWMSGLFVFFFVAGCVSPYQSSEHNATTLNQQEIDKLPKGIVVTANPHATKAGADILRAGGSAVDAAIAVEAVLSLVEPQSSGFGGGGFMVYYDKASKKISAYNGRETAPKSATKEMFLDAKGQPIQFIKAKNSGISIGVPGMVSMLALAHKEHGKLPWGVQLRAAKKLAEEGFEVSPRLHTLIKKFVKYIPSQRSEGTLDARQYLFDEQDQPLPLGYLLKNPAYAKTLDNIAQSPQHFYQGIIAQSIVEQVGKFPRSGSMTLKDIAQYEASKSDAICVPYKTSTLCGPPPPSSWLSVAMIMQTIEKLPDSFFADNDKENKRLKNWKAFSEAQRLSYADRDQYIADSTLVAVPVQGLLNQNYIAKRAALIQADSPINSVQAGNPWQYQKKKTGLIQPKGKDATYDAAGTTHFVIVDADGNVVSLTASVESVFGSTRMVGGMFLNNQLTDFSFRYQDKDGQSIANAVSPGKQPRSSMSPTIVLNEKGDFLMATGSPGGSSIIAYTAKTLLGVLDWGLTPQQAIDLPNMVSRGDKVRIEKQRASDAFIQGLRAYGYHVFESAGENSGLSVVYQPKKHVLIGGVDKRREGVVEIVY